MQLVEKHGDDAGGHQVRHGSGQHGAEAKPRKIVAAVGDQRADAADLHADGAEVGEAAQRKGGDGESARSERALLQAKLRVGDELVQHRARAQQVADLLALMPGNADEPRNGRGQGAETRSERVRETECGHAPRAQFEMPSMHALTRPTSARKLISMMATLKASAPPSMVPRAMAPTKFSLACSSDGGMWTVPAVAGTSVSGTSILATRMVPGAVMMTAESRSFALMPN